MTRSLTVFMARYISVNQDVLMSSRPIQPYIELL